MSQLSETFDARFNERSNIRAQACAHIIWLAICLAVLYRGVATDLVLQWWSDPNWSHGLLVPVFCMYVVWRSRDRIKGLPLRPNWIGLLLVMGAMCILVLGVFGAENFLSRMSLLFTIAGFLVFFGGWSLFRVALFPWAALFLMVPLPAIVFNQ